MTITSRKWIEAEALFSKNSYDGEGKVSVGVEGEEGGCVLIVATHGVNHFSGPESHNKKVADLYTGGLARIIAKEAKVRCVYNRFRSMKNNPHIGETDIDRRITEIVHSEQTKIILDLHGARDNETFDVAVGTGALPLTPRQSKLMCSVLTVLCDLGWAVAVNPPSYKAAKPVSIVSRHKALTRGAALQLEVVRRLRSPESDLGLKFANDMLTVVREIKRRCPK